MTTDAPTYAQTVAPYPKRIEDVTAETLAKHLACQVLRDSASMFGHYWEGDRDDKQGARDYAFLAARVSGYYGVVYLLRALMAHAPDRANGVARRLWDDWDGGEACHEKPVDWLADWGVDPEKVIAEAPTWQRIDSAQVGAGNGEAVRGSAVEAWIRRTRDEQMSDSNAWHALDGLLDDYREHADCGTPLAGPVHGPHAEAGADR